MPDTIRPQLGRLLTLPLATIGVLAAVLLWELEHMDSPALTAAILGGAVLVVLLLARRVHRHIAELSAYYEALLATADEQSRRAEAANRLKDDFLATLSHELRTPLNAILGWTRLLESGKLEDAQARRAIEAIERAGWSQSRLIDDLLDLSRLVAGTLEIVPRPTAVEPLLASVADGLAPAAAAKRITMSSRLETPPRPVMIDPDRVRQIVWNLLSNAIKFTPAGGHVELHARTEVRELILEVLDSGIGFSPRVAAHLFERFRQGDSSSTREHGGAGVGLGLVRHLVELHGGTVSGASRGPNQGATFRVRLPLRFAAEPPPIPEETNGSRVQLHGLSVLVVDDDPQLLQLVGSALEPYGARVTTASSAREARDLFLESRPDVLVCDLVMPGEDGLALIREIRALPPERGGRTPAAALTAMARTDDRREALEAGYQMHLTKPLDPDDLAQAIQDLSARRNTPP